MKVKELRDMSDAVLGEELLKIRRKQFNLLMRVVRVVAQIKGGRCEKT
jgi:ribosomal protein L29